MTHRNIRFVISRHTNSAKMNNFNVIREKVTQLYIAVYKK